MLVVQRELFRRRLKDWRAQAVIDASKSPSGEGEPNWPSSALLPNCLTLAQAQRPFAIRIQATPTRQTVQQFERLKIRRSANFMKFRNVRRILKLLNCEMVYREWICLHISLTQTPSQGQVHFWPWLSCQKVSWCPSFCGNALLDWSGCQGWSILVGA